jgi:hypothetical protein
MIAESRRDCFHKLVLLGMHYPEMRFGQLVCFACEMAGDNELGRRDEVPDRNIILAVEQHLAERFGSRARPIRSGLASLTETRGALVKALDDVGSAFTDWSTVKVVSKVAELAHVHLYDAEDDQLLQAARDRAPGLKWFTHYTESLAHNSTLKERRDKPSYACPCCGFRTLYERGGFEICPVCYWEDDGQDDNDAGTVRGGPNGGLSLIQARANYRSFRACDAKFVPHVRPPRPEEE